jgi:hypothetical protein
MAVLAAGSLVLALLMAVAGGKGQKPGVGVAIAAIWCSTAFMYAPRARRGVEPREGRVVFAMSRPRLAAHYAAATVMGVAFAVTYGGSGGLAYAGFLVLAVVVSTLLGTYGGTLTLDAEGVTYARGLRRRCASWDAVGPVGAKRWDVIATRGLGKVSTGMLADDPVVVYWTLHRYATYPEARAELAG